MKILTDARNGRWIDICTSSDITLVVWSDLEIWYYFNRNCGGYTKIDAGEISASDGLKLFNTA